jgi:hypothetical protein
LTCRHAVPLGVAVVKVSTGAFPATPTWVEDVPVTEPLPAPPDLPTVESDAPITFVVAGWYG